MNALERWGKFNLVGAMGMAIQLGALAALTHWSGRHYLAASAAATELAVLHNFMWHVRFTWRDRGGVEGPAAKTRRGQLVRFHLSNGLVSLGGSVVLMRLLVKEAHVQLLVANLIAIACCSLVNFVLADVWAFRGAAKKTCRLAGHRGATCAAPPGVSV